MFVSSHMDPYENILLTALCTSGVSLRKASNVYELSKGA